MNLQHFNQMCFEHSKEIRYIHAIGEGTRFGLIYITSEDDAYGVGYNGDFNLLGISGENFLKKRLEKPEKILRLCGKGIKKISVGDHVGVGLGRNGELYQWGLQFSEIRNGYDKTRVQLPQLTSCGPAVYVEAGGGFYAVLSNRKKVFMYGYVDWSAPFSDGRLFSPMQKEVKSISCGAWHVAMVTADGKIYTFGHGGYGQLGYDWTEDNGYWRVRKVSLKEPCVNTTSGSVSTFCLTESGKLWAFGLNHQQFGYLGVESEEPSIKQPLRVKIDEPVSEVYASFTLSSLRNVYAAKSRDDSKIYVWGWGCESKWPQHLEGAKSLKDVFSKLATLAYLGDRFTTKLFEETMISKKSEEEEDEALVVGQDPPPQSSTNNIKLRYAWENACGGLLSRADSKTNLFPLDNFKKFSSSGINSPAKPNRTLNRSESRQPKVLNNTTSNAVCCQTAYRSYLDYVYSGGNLHLEYAELIDVYFLAILYEENQLIDHTFDQIERRTSISNFRILLEKSKAQKSDGLTGIYRRFIHRLCQEPDKIIELIISLTV